jgi:hypothetical protein
MNISPVSAVDKPKDHPGKPSDGSGEEARSLFMRATPHMLRPKEGHRSRKEEPATPPPREEGKFHLYTRQGRLVPL